MGRIAILGVFVADATFRAARLPQMGETLLGDGFALGPGGKGSNQAVAAGRAGGDATMLTRIGTDPFGDLAMDTWRGAGVTAQVHRMADTATGAAFIYVDSATGENAIIISPGAAGHLSVKDVAGWQDQISGADLFLTQLEQPVAVAQAALEQARAAGVRTLLNPAPAAPLPEGILALCDFVTPNETEAEMLTGTPVDTLDSAECAAQHLRQMGAGAVVLTLGARGVLYHDQDQTVHIPALPVDAVVDTTGAGDSFNGAFAVALAEGADPVAAARFGCAAAAISVTRPGAAASMPTRAEIEARLT